MVKRKAHTTTASLAELEQRPGVDGPVTTHTNDVEQAHAEAGINPNAEQPQNGNGKTEKKYSVLNQFHTIPTPDNKLHVGKNDRFRMRSGAQGAFIIYFDNNPNEGRAKEDPHPVIAHVKQAGYRYEQAPDGEMAWLKPYDQSRGWTMRQQMDADDVGRQAANLLGANVEVGQGQSR
jgi:hypothetical protein